jgi:hypothetical protein
MRKPKNLILAVPVAPTDSLAAMQQEADEVVCLEAHTDFGAIGLIPILAGPGRRSHRVAGAIFRAKTETVIPARSLKAGPRFNSPVYS